MLPQAVVEQQAKLGVSAEASKIERVKRQQARFRDRGGAFVPSTANPLVDILLARAVSGESPSKARPKESTVKRSSLGKVRQSAARRASAVTVSDESQISAGTRSKPSTSLKRKKKATEQEDVAVKEQGGKQTKGKKRADTDSGVVQPPSSTKPKSTSKGRSKQCDTSTTQPRSEGNVKPKPRARAKAKAVAEMLVSDDDRPLVDARPYIKSSFKKNLQNENDGEMDESPIVGNSGLPPMDDIQPSGTKTTVRTKEEKVARKGRSGKKAEDKETTAAIITEEGRATPRKPVGDAKTKGRAKPKQTTTEPAENDERPLQRSFKPQKRKKEDGHDDRPRKTVKFSDTSPTRVSSQNLKENQSDKLKTVAKSRIKDDPHILRLKLTAKFPSRTKGSKGPPREVLERIKASAGRHLQCADSDPDELDCFS